MLSNLAQIAIGGALGASARYLTSVAMMRLVGPGFPWATLTVNVLGSFLMGAVVVGLAHLNGTRYAPFVMTGVLGGFTTFSAFSLDVLTLWERGQAAQTWLYVAASVGVSLVAIALGMAAMRALVQ